jgi:NRPS condensation-like uncharacterized protein
MEELPALFCEALKENVHPLAIPFLKPIVKLQQSKPIRPQYLIKRIVIEGHDYSFTRSVARDYKLTINDYLLCALLKTSIETRNEFNTSSFLTGTLFTINLRRYQNNNPVTLANYSSAGICIAKSKDFLSFSKAAN